MTISACVSYPYANENIRYTASHQEIDDTRLALPKPFDFDIKGQ